MFHQIYDIISVTLFTLLFIIWNSKDFLNFFIKVIFIFMAISGFIIVLWDNGFIIKL